MLVAISGRDIFWGDTGSCETEQNEAWLLYYNYRGTMCGKARNAVGRFLLKTAMSLMAGGTQTKARRKMSNPEEERGENKTAWQNKTRTAVTRGNTRNRGKNERNHSNRRIFYSYSVGWKIICVISLLNTLIPCLKNPHIEITVTTGEELVTHFVMTVGRLTQQVTKTQHQGFYFTFKSSITKLSSVNKKSDFQVTIKTFSLRKSPFNEGPRTQLAN